MIGETVVTDKGKFTITKAIAIENRPNAHIYLCEDGNGDKFIAKHFYDKPPKPNISYAVKNHYGRRRDGSEHVFNEIKDMNPTYDFLLKHITRAKHNGKWIAILEYIEGDTIEDYITTHHKTDPDKAENAVAGLAKALVTWHTNGFAHGDPHPGNAMIEYSTGRIVLIDYSQIHHKEFYYCQEYECFSKEPLRRIKQDINNDDKKLGKGFRTELSRLQEELQLGTRLTDVFDRHYTFDLSPAEKS